MNLLTKVFVVFSFLFFSIVAQGYAQNASIDRTTIKPIDITIDDIQTESRALHATLHINNPNNISYENINYAARFLSPDVIENRLLGDKLVTMVGEGDLISFTNSSSFSISAHQSRDFSLVLPFSKAINSGDYKIQVSISDTNNKLLGSGKEIVSLSGNNLFLTINNCLIIADGVEYSPTVGPNVEPKTPVYGTCTVTNPTNNTTTVHTKTTYAVHQVIGYQDSEKETMTSSDLTTLQAHASKKIIFPLPPLTTPQVYEALSYLVNSDDQQVSPQVGFRWVIVGPSSTIRSLSLDASSYEQGQTAKVTVAADPSMDLFWEAGGSPIVTFPNKPQSSFFQPKLRGTPLKDPKITVTITDAQGNICGKKEQRVDSKTQRSWSDQSLDVSIQKECNEAKVTAIIKDEDKQLAIKSTAPSIPASIPQEGSNTSLIIFLIISIFVGIILFIAGFLYWRRRKQVMPVLFIGLFYITLAAFPNKTLAAPLEVRPGQDLSVTTTSISIPHQSPNACTGYIGWQHTAEGGGKCTVSIQFTDKASFDLLNTQDQIAFNGNNIKGRVMGRLTSVGCENTHAGLIIRAYVDGSNQGLTINGSPQKLVLSNLVTIAHTEHTASRDIDQDLTISSGSTIACGTHNVKIVVIPFYTHVDMIASDPSEEAPRALFEGTPVTYGGRQNCGGTDPCWGVLQKDVKKLCQCNEACTTPADCDATQNGCSTCRATVSGGQKTCQPPVPPACGAVCERDAECTGARDGCTWCATTGVNAGKCIHPVACGATCTTPADCENTRDGCTACIPNDTGTGSSCKTPPACGTSCTKDSQCAGARNGCNFCSGGKCSAFSEDMCSCDGMDFSGPSGNETFFPGDNVSFIAYGVVPGNKWKGSPNAAVSAAQVTSITFYLYQSSLTNPNQSTLIANSAAITPQVVQNDPNKVRYKVTWDRKIPTTVPAGTLFRIQAKVACSAKPGVLGAKTQAVGSSNYFTQLFDVVSSLFARGSGSVLGTTTRQDQHADTFFPGAKIQEKSCDIIKFFFE